MNKHLRVILVCFMLAVAGASAMSLAVRAAYAADEECKDENKEDCKK